MSWSRFLFSFFLVAGVTASFVAEAEESPSPVEAVISVKDQRMIVLREGGMIARYPISTSRFGIGDSGGSYKTPLGRLKVCDKLGGGLPAGAVIRHRQATGEVIPVNAPGRDPIVTRILWLEGCESQNSNARARSIYIHGTPEEKTIGKPASYGCVRMRSNDVMALYDDLPVGSTITIIEEKLPRYAKYVPRPEPVKTETLIAAKKETPVAPTPAVPAPVPAPPPIAALESPRKVAPAKVAATTARPEIAMAITSPRIAQSMRGSILSAGLDGNSEIPQLRQ